VSGVLALGPLAIPHAVLLVLAALAAALAVGHVLGTRRGVDAGPALWRAFLAGIVAARLGFVWEFSRAYLDAPLTILDVRDGGWNPVAGLAGVLLYSLSQALRFPALRSPLHWAVGVGSMFWIAGSVVLALHSGTGQPVPSVRLAGLDGTPVELQSFIGRPTVVNLWATWCPPCVREMPVLQKAQADHPGVNFVFVNQGESPEQVAVWLQRRRLDLRNVLVDGHRRAGAALGHTAYPTTLFYDAQGRLVATRVGEVSAATLAEKLERLKR
jgi:thiol-disulfide isomerase/thioredoxin